jgi:clan AA aspartic protease
MGINIPWTGYTFNDGTPVLRIQISSSDATPHEFDAILDTGFNGFLSIPQSVADTLGLERLTTERIFFADNSEHIRWTSLATITVGSQSEDGLVYLEPSSEEVLLGVEFLRRFNRMMLFYPTQDFLHFIETRAAAELINKFHN